MAGKLGATIYFASDIGTFCSVILSPKLNINVKRSVILINEVVSSTRRAERWNVPIIDHAPSCKVSTWCVLYLTLFLWSLPIERVHTRLSRAVIYWLGGVWYYQSRYNRQFCVTLRSKKLRWQTPPQRSTGRLGRKRLGFWMGSCMTCF